MTDEERKVFQDALETWSAKRQLLMLIEECGELVQAAAKFANGRGEYGPLSDALCEEIADVQIMLDQIALAIPDGIARVQFARAGKVRRLRQRIYETLKPSKV